MFDGFPRYASGSSALAVLAVCPISCTRRMAVLIQTLMIVTIEPIFIMVLMTFLPPSRPFLRQFAHRNGFGNQHLANDRLGRRLKPACRVIVAVAVLCRGGRITIAPATGVAARLDATALVHFVCPRRGRCRLGGFFTPFLSVLTSPSAFLI